jgi:hypothetical protein
MIFWRYIDFTLLFPLCPSVSQVRNTVNKTNVNITYMLVLLASFCWQNHYHVILQSQQGYRIISEVFKYSEFIFLIWKGPYYDKFQCHKLQEGNFKVPGRFCEVSNSVKVRSLVPVWTVQWSVQKLFCVEKILTAQRASVRMSRQQPSGRSSVFEKNPDFLCRHGSGKTTCNRPDSALIRKHVKRIMERRLHSSPSEPSMPPSGRRLEKSKSVSI